MSQKKNYLYVVGRQDAAHYFFLLGHCERLAILETLSKFGSTSFKGFALNCPLSKSTLSQHLRLLKQAGIILPCKIGKGSGYVLHEEGLAHARRVMSGYLSKLKTYEALGEIA